jgi:hypothetical protein
MQIANKSIKMWQSSSTELGNDINKTKSAFMKKLNAYYILGMLLTIKFRIFCLHVCYLKM